MSRSLIAGLMVVGLLGAMAPATLADEGLTPPDYTVESTILDRGVEPWLDLTYDWAVGQTETMVIEMWDADATLLDGYLIDEQPGVPVRVQVTATVEQVEANGTVLLETAVDGVELVDPALVDDANRARVALESLVGLRVREQLDQHGYVLARETVDPQPTLTGSHALRDMVAENLEGMTIRLPLEPVGPGGTWEETVEHFDERMGVSEIATLTKTVMGIEGDRLADVSVDSVVSVPLQTVGALDGPFGEGAAISMEGAASVTTRIDLGRIAQAGSGTREANGSMTMGNDDGTGVLDLLGLSGIAYAPLDWGDSDWPALAPVEAIELPSPQADEASVVDSAATPAEASVDVVLLDPGAEPRQELRYAWQEGQVEDQVMVMRIGMRISNEGEWSPWIGVPGNEVASTTTVTNAYEDGTYEVQVVFTDVRIPQGSATLPPEALTEMEAQMSQMVGMSQVMRLDDRGRILSSETSVPPGADLGALQPGQLDAATQEFIDPLPAEPVGEGAVWEVARQSSDAMGFVTYGTNTYTLDGIDPDGLLHLGGDVTMTADPQPMSLEGVPPSMDTTIDRFDLAGELSKTIDLALVNVKSASSSAVAEYAFTVAIGDTEQVTEMDMSFEMDARLLGSSLAAPFDE